PPTDPFKAHLISLLSLYELHPIGLKPKHGPGVVSNGSHNPIPKYEGPTDWQTDAIFRSIGEIVSRMWRAERVVEVLRA
ncbi:hypothetical protein BJ165DRAFT_1332673, partial [Panaeolus papilionaceus]